jgi:hypothetical protein
VHLWKAWKRFIQKHLALNKPVDCLVMSVGRCGNYQPCQRSTIFSYLKPVKNLAGLAQAIVQLVEKPV